MVVEVVGVSGAMQDGNITCQHGVDGDGEVLVADVNNFLMRTAYGAFARQHS